MWFRQMAQLSTTISQAQRATAFHYCLGVSYCDLSMSMLWVERREVGSTFLTSKRFLSSPPDLPALVAAAFAGGASVISTSAIVCEVEGLFWVVWRV